LPHEAEKGKQRRAEKRVRVQISAGSTGKSLQGAHNQKALATKRSDKRERKCFSRGRKKASIRGSCGKGKRLSNQKRVKTIRRKHFARRGEKAGVYWDKQKRVDSKYKRVARQTQRGWGLGS